MLSIGEFSKACQVSTKTLRYYEEIDLLNPIQVNHNGYRYYSINQLDKMMKIQRLKSYRFSLEEIKEILNLSDEEIYSKLISKRKEIETEILHTSQLLNSLNNDIESIKNGIHFMDDLNQINIELVELNKSNILSIRQHVLQNEFENAYQVNYGQLFKRIADEHLTILGPPMILYHDSEFSIEGLDSEFAIPILENVKGTRIFNPKTCLKTTLVGNYHQLNEIYVSLIKYADKHQYKNNNALFEIYVSDPSITQQEDCITEIYYPVEAL